MTIKESLKVVNLLHNAYPQDRKATQEELFNRAESYSILLAEYDLKTVMAAIGHLLKTCSFYPTPTEIIDAVVFTKTMKEAVITSIPKAETISEEELNEWTEAFCEWIGIGSEENIHALDNYYDKHPDRFETMTRWLNYEK